ncbi:hypothetical protein BC938DRAFT_483381 [Jimgerdemannia flammicorona]|uniref:Uncharacterized protein n=1 Tax=Jimgerdemannia flammicorona TaxID=994334 RepID=A0A433QC85_9FUNG|nr:hypothetical protein BC938DRAFT_483381 [Jimgerdemannia flammicorona]
MPATVASLGSLPLPDLGSTFDPKTLPWLQAPLRLISLDLLPRIDRAVSILRHRELNGAIERGGRRIPNLLYLPDPFQTASLHLVYNHLNLERFTIENVRAAVQSGSLEGLLSAEDSKNLPASILSFLESLCLVILYIRAFALPTGEPPEFITKICDKAIPPTTSSHFHSSLWYEAFTEHNVRLTDYQQVGSPQRMAPSNVYMNEVCERIRLVKVREDLGIKEGAEAQRYVNCGASFSYLVLWFIFVEPSMDSYRPRPLAHLSSHPTTHSYHAKDIRFRTWEAPRPIPPLQSAHLPRLCRRLGQHYHHEPAPPLHVSHPSPSLLVYARLSQHYRPAGRARDRHGAAGQSCQHHRALERVDAQVTGCEGESRS